MIEVPDVNGRELIAGNNSGIPTKRRPRSVGTCGHKHYKREREPDEPTDLHVTSTSHEVKRNI